MARARRYGRRTGEARAGALRQAGGLRLTDKLVLIGGLAIAGCSDGGPTSTADVWVWPEATPEAQGLDPAILESLTVELEAGRLGPVASALVVRRGQLVYEEYFRGKSSTDTHPLASVTKSITAAAVGIAHGRGLLPDLQEPVLGFFAEYPEVENDGDWKRAMTVEHALQMRTGLAWDDELALALSSSPDPIRFTLDLPMAAPPGTEFTYHNGASELLSGIVAHAAETSLEDFTRTHLFDPLGIEAYFWYTSPTGVSGGSAGLYMRPRDMAKLGYLHLHRGLWPPTGERLMSEEWVDASFLPHTQFDNGGYGYQWWLTSLEVEGEPIPLPYATGSGGQWIFVVDPLEMVVVLTGEHWQGEPSHAGEILFDYLVAAAGLGG